MATRLLAVVSTGISRALATPAGSAPTMARHSTSAAALLLLLACGGAAALHDNNDFADNTALPSHFDSRAFYGCADNVLNQAECGSCWAVSAVGTVADRFCVHNHKQFGFMGSSPLALSPQPLVSCASSSVGPTGAAAAAYQSQGCNGGYQEEAWRFLEETGTAETTAELTGGCRPYWSGSCTPDNEGNGCLPCEAVRECIDSGDEPVRYSVVGAGAVVGSEHNMDAQVAAVQREIARNGPVQACFDVFSNFFDFFSDTPTGTYNSTADSPIVGGHCVKIIGWGRTQVEDMPYWLIANSWGEGWGQKGVFRYIRGADLGGMDTAVWAGCPSGTQCQLTPAVVPPEAAPAKARRSGGRWHAAAPGAVSAAVQRNNVDGWLHADTSAQHPGAHALLAVVRHLKSGAAPARSGALDATTRQTLLDALTGRSGDRAEVMCTHTQVVSGLRTRLVLLAAPPNDGREGRAVVATTRLAPPRVRGGATAAQQHTVESLTAIDVDEAVDICYDSASDDVSDSFVAADDWPVPSPTE